MTSDRESTPSSFYRRIQRDPRFVQLRMAVRPKFVLMFMHDHFLPACESLRQAGLLAKWNHLLVPTFGILLEVRPRHGTSHDSLVNALFDRLAPAMQEGILQWDRQWDPDPSMVGRWGSAQGVKLYGSYWNRMSPLSVALLKLLQEEECEPFEVPITTFSFIIETLGIPVEKRLSLLREWYQVFSGQCVEDTPPENQSAALETLKSQVAEVWTSNAESLRWINDLAREGWRTTPTRELKELLQAYAPRFERIGRSLTHFDHRGHFDVLKGTARGRGKNFVILHSYGHWMMFNLMSAGFRELIYVGLLERAYAQNSQIS